MSNAASSETSLTAHPAVAPQRPPDPMAASDEVTDTHPTPHPVNTASNVEAFSAFYRLEFTPVARTLYLIVHDVQRAEDLTQEAFVRLLEHWGKVSEYDRPGAWVRRVAIRLATRHVRRERLRGSVERDHRPSEAISPVDVDLLRAVATLPPKYRAAVALHYFEDRPVSEVAELLGTSPGTAKVWLHRARRRLAELLRDEGAR